MDNGWNINMLKKGNRFNLLGSTLIATVFAFASPASAGLIVAETFAGDSANTESDTSFAVSNTSVSEDTGSASATALGSYLGAYAAHSQAVGTTPAGNAMSTWAHTSFADTITNTLGMAAAVQYSFYIYGGTLDTNSIAALVSGEYLAASYTAKLSVNGSDVWGSSASLKKVGGISTLSTSGAVLNPGDDGTDGNYNWSGQLFTINLGVLAAGESIALSADVFSAAESLSAPQSYESCWDNNGTPECTTLLISPNALAAVGELNEFEVIPGQFTYQLTPIPPTGVPAPSVLALLGIGLLVSSLARRLPR